MAARFASSARPRADVYGHPSKVRRISFSFREVIVEHDASVNLIVDGCGVGAGRAAFITMIRQRGHDGHDRDESHGRHRHGADRIQRTIRTTSRRTDHQHKASWITSIVKAGPATVARGATLICR